MTPEPANVVVCPSCGAANIEGSDSCERCLMDLTSIDIPEAAQVLKESDLALPISALRLSRAAKVAPQAAIREAIDLMRRDHVGAVVVVEAGKAVGIFSDRDVLRRVAAVPGALDQPVAAVMTPDPVVLREDDMVAAALNKMGVGGFRHIPVVRDGELIGMLTGRDVLNWVMGRYFD
ncbi:cyclic nucleotide-binding/CBS domain-containing protein [Tepidiforma sp.]|uniref:CBS domain-containing protein n=1 Tax=Tepidiforma sp. TaxID=2682230 RepID=UPI002ADD710C|nr:CBS domain-containing protein [Tepidiforma sp.]